MSSEWTVQYYQRVLATDPFAYWMLDEKSGAVAYDLVSGRVAGAQNGAHTGVTLWQDGIGDGRTCPLYDGANDYTNIYTAAFAGAFPGAEGSVAIWVQVSGAGVWTDGNEHRLVTMLANNDNFILIRKATTNNTLQWIYKAGTASKFFSVGGYSSTDWFHTVLTWSKSADEANIYYNGSSAAATQNGLGVWAGALNPVYTVIGSTDTVPSSVWSGYLAHVALWNSALTPAQVASLARNKV